MGIYYFKYISLTRNECQKGREWGGSSCTPNKPAGTSRTFGVKFEIDRRNSSTQRTMPQLNVMANRLLRTQCLREAFLLGRICGGAFESVPVFGEQGKRQASLVGAG